jgi:Yip1 domain
MSTNQLDTEFLAHQRELLATHRRNLTHLLEQAAKYGSETDTPLHIFNSIREARAGILQAKTILHANGIEVTDYPHDDPPVRQTETGQSVQSNDKRLAVSIDFERSVKSVGHVIAAYAQIFVGILTTPNATFNTLLGEADSDKYKVIKAHRIDERPIFFAGISLLIGVVIASSLSFKGAPDQTTRDIIRIVVPYLFIWFIYGIGIHFSARILGGKGSLVQSVTGVLYVLGALHPLLLFIIYILSSVFPGLISYQLALRDISSYGEVFRQYQRLDILGFSLSVTYYIISFILTAFYLYFPLSVSHKLPPRKVFSLYLLAMVGIIGFACISATGLVIIQFLLM